MITESARPARRGTVLGHVALAAAAVAYVISFNRPWLRIQLDGWASSLDPIGGATSPGRACYQLYLIGMPILLALAAATAVRGPRETAFRPGTDGVAGMVETRRQSAAGAAALGLAVAIVIALLALLHSMNDQNYGGFAPTRPAVRPGYFVALAAPILVALSVLVGGVIRAGARRPGTGGRWALGLGGLAVTAYAVALWVPWLRISWTDDGPNTELKLLMDTTFGVAYALVAALLLALVGAALATGDRLWRLAAIVLSGSWTLVTLLVVASPGRVLFLEPDTAYAPRLGIYTALVMMVSAGAAALTAGPRPSIRSAPMIPLLMWSAGAAGFVVALLAPWETYTSNGRQPVGILAGAGSYAGPVTLLFLVGASLLLVTSALAGTAPDAGPMRWATTCIAIVLIIVEVAVIAAPKRFWASDGYTANGTASIGSYIAVATTLLLAGTAWTRQAGTAPVRPALRVQDWTARIVLAASLVAFTASLHHAWIHVRYVRSDDAEFEGAILQSPIGFLFLSAWTLVTAVTGAAISARRTRAAWQVAALVLALSYATLAVYVSQVPPLIGYDFLIVQIVGATYYWQDGSAYALGAFALAMVALALSVRRSTSIGEADRIQLTAGRDADPPYSIGAADDD